MLFGHFKGGPFLIVFENEKMIEKSPVCFLHIPKSGGKSLWAILKKQEDTFHIWHRKLFKELDKKVEFFTLLRDPVDRVISTYYYIRRYEEDPLHDKVLKLSLEDFVAIMEDERHKNIQYKKKDIRSIRYRTVNLATRYLSGGDPNNIALAKYHAREHFSMIGFTDMYEESLFFLQKQYNLTIPTIPHRNQTNNRPSLQSHSQEIIKRIEKMNAHDIHLYNWAKARFEQRISSLDSKTKKEFDKWLEQFNKTNKL